MMRIITYAAPAKLNLFLHITGRRSDGYHTLQTVFQLVDWGDRLRLTLRNDGIISRTPRTAFSLKVAESSDLTLRAARLLQAQTGCALGVNIEVEKQLPIGAGLGGGSSDAASTLLALNRLWKLHLPRIRLQALAQTLGADVPFFVFGQNAFAEGIGEQLQPVHLPQRHFLIIVPNLQIASAEIFASQELTRQTKPIRITDFMGLQYHPLHPCWPDDFGHNDMQAVVSKKYIEVKNIFNWFKGMAPARLTGSGAGVFAVFRNKEAAMAAQASICTGWCSQVATSLSYHPLFKFAE